MFGSRLLRNDRGIAAVEFAFVAPIMILMICGFMEYAHVSSARSTLEAATMRAARAVSATDCPDERDEIMMGIITNGMKTVPSANGGVVDIVTKSYGGSFGDVGEPEPFDDLNDNGKWDEGESYTDVNGNGKHDNDMGKTGSIGAAGQVVSYNATFQVASLFNFIALEYNGSSVYEIEASTVIRNEPVFRSSGCT